MKLDVGATCVLFSDTILWRQYPTGKPTDGQSYHSMHRGSTLTIVGEQVVENRDLLYVMDEAGCTYVIARDYLLARVRILI